jgi:hypothetical protein
MFLQSGSVCERDEAKLDCYLVCGIDPAKARGRQAVTS